MALITKSKPRITKDSKRRQGRHHRHDEHYLKPYWPYIPLVLMVAAGLIFNTLWGATQRGVLDYATSMSVSSLQAGTNSQRVANGLGTLALNSTLNQAAQAKANDMVARNYWSHNTPDGQPPWTFITNAGYQYQTAGENLAYGFATSDDTINGWMNSPGHRANILNNTYTEVGFGFANSENFNNAGQETVVVAMYASPYNTPAPAVAPAAQQPATKPAATQQAPVASEQPAQPTPTPQPTSEQPAEKSKETNATANTAHSTQAAAKTVSTENVSRIQLLTNGTAPWSMFAVTAFATICLAIFFLRHGLFWHRTLIKGERFIIKHKLLDIVLVGTAVIGFILTRTSGVIR